ncbi:cytochrome P450 [Polyangium fumosum]|uniref:Cytochrome P450 n=1 Tax=Polyangium fumosum TaxID=889272 RepID=A0A4V5PNQ8_9BACT|nr:cytochrome P450 [Polyangium fumosum]TKD08646.1 cytochrome P450 [Polyangium fumosum]
MPANPKLPRVPIPGPRAFPVLGESGNSFRFFSKPVTSLLALHRRHGDIAAITGGSPAMVCAFGAEHNRAVLGDDSTFLSHGEPPFPLPEDSALGRMLRENMMSKNGQDHRRLRRMLMPAFQRARILAYRDEIVDVTEASLRRVVPGGVVDASRVMLDLMLGVIMRCLFGVDVSAGGDPLGPLSIALLEGFLSPANLILPYDVPGTPYRKLLRDANRLEERLLALIEERRATRDGRDMFSALIHAHDEDGSRLSDVELVAQSILVYIAAYETTAQSLSWTLLLLALHPEILYDLEDEVDTVLRGEAPTAEQAASMPLLDAVLKESARILPATPICSFRLVGEEATLGKYTLPKGSRILLSPLVTHRMGDVFPEPTRFLPERWSRITPTPFEYLPFGAGPRMCIGHAFANMAMRLILPMALQRFRFALRSNTEISLQLKGISGAPKNGLPMDVTTRRAPRPGNTRRPEPKGEIRALVDLS